MNKGDLQTQFEQSIKILSAIVPQFKVKLWRGGGCGYQTPVRIAYHTLLGIGYYIGYETHLESGVGSNLDTIDDADLPSQEDILQSIGELLPQLQLWLSALDLSAENEKFPWAGKTNTGLALFLLRHTMYHIGEMNGLIYQMNEGAVEDLWMKGFDE